MKALISILSLTCLVSFVHNQTLKFVVQDLVDPPASQQSCSRATEPCNTTSNIQRNCCQSLSCVNGVCDAKIYLKESVNITSQEPTQEQIPQQNQEQPDREKYFFTSDTRFTGQRMYDLVGTLLEFLYNDPPKGFHQRFNKDLKWGQTMHAYGLTRCNTNNSTQCSLCVRRLCDDIWDRMTQEKGHAMKGAKWMTNQCYLQFEFYDLNNIEIWEGN